MNSAEKTTPSPAGRETEPVRALLIEDSADDQILLTRALKMGGFDPAISRAETAEEFVQALAKHNWDVIIADYYLPRFSAIETLKYVRDNNIDIPCIVVSGKIGEENAAEVMRLGAADYITKGNLLRLAPAIRREVAEFRLRKAHRATQQELERTQEVVQQQKIREHEVRLLSQIVSGVAHEVRNPLNAITALLEAFFMEIGEAEEYTEYRSHITQQIERLTKLMEDLLELGKPLEPEGLTNIDMAQVCAGALNLWRAADTVHGRDVSFLNAADHTRIIGNETRLQNALINLLDNAAQHSSEESPIVLKLFNENEWLVLQVIDEGAGIDPEYLDRVLEPFFTTRRAGTGLGLGLVRHTIEAHHGSIRLRNNERQKGATVEIRLPLA